MIGLNHYMILATILFGIGMYGVLFKRNAIAVLMSVELMLNSVNINLIALGRFTNPEAVLGQTFAIFVIVVAAAEVAVGLALIISIFRKKKTIDLNNFNLLKW